MFAIGSESKDDHSKTKSDTSELESDKEEQGGILKYSLFSSASNASPSELDETQLAEVRDTFRAVWFTYDYCITVRSETSIEQCLESVRLGKVRAVLSPDVVHRLEMFHLSLSASLEVVPVFSKGEYL